jgi:hypothetical protein
MLESIRHWWTLRRLTQEWIAFRSYVEHKLGFPGVTPTDEEGFLKLKARIASRIPRLAGDVPLAAATDTQKQFAEMTELLGRYRSLQAPSALADREREDFDRAWHQQFIFLNKLRGMRPARQPGAAVGKRPFVPTGTPSYRRRRFGFPGAGFIRFAFRLLIFVVVVYVLGRTIGIRKDEVGHVGFQPPTSLQSAATNFIEGSRSVGGAVGQILSPVVAAYGIEMTLILVGVLVLGVGYLVFVRG